jgi:predicted AlkP superfamily phosphohydrolase/phosphomutase
MSSTNGLKVLAIGLDAAEPTLIKQMIDEGSMPSLAALMAEGRWLSLKAPADIGSASVWPTFVTGTMPTQHGIYSEWNWLPNEMKLERYHGRELVPFWKNLDDMGIPVGILDVPLTTTVGLKSGFEVSEWWSHDYVIGKPQVNGNGIATVLKEHPVHPFTINLQDSVHPEDLEGLHNLKESCIEGIRLRGTLAQRLIDQSGPAFTLIVFPETHHAGHLMWHTAAPDHPLYSGQTLYSSEPLLEQVYRAVDQQIANLIESIGRDAVVIVFSLHGMKASFGCPFFLQQLLCAKGFSQIVNWKSQSWSERKRHLLARVKKKAPSQVRQLYYRLAPKTTIQQVAQPTMMPVYDWQNTRAFSSPSDQYGWIRINLKGREAKGSVPEERYQETCDELESMLRHLRNREGKPLVHNVLRTVSNGSDSLQHRIPDLIAHWTNHAFSPHLQIEGVDIEPELQGVRTGQHALTGFCVVKGGPEKEIGSSIRAEEIGDFITRILIPQ